jgi:25S rRNA (adenine2142-N1)-methyltransferase
MPSSSAPSPSPETERFNTISCSLVLNFVDTPTLRGLMLRRTHAFLRPHPSSLLFLVLPLPCVNNSRYLDRARLGAIMAEVGFELVRERWKEGNKVGYWLWAWRAPGTKAHVRGQSLSERELHKKVVLRDGPGFNNFAICLPPPGE